VLGLTLADGELRACHVAQAKGRPEVVRTASATLSLDVLHPEPELVGREIKNHLDAAGIRERHCVVALPARWMMTQHSAVPELSPEDTASFLQIEAEKYFPVDPAQLQIARSEQKTAAGRYVTQLAVRREQLDQLAAALKAAGLKPVSFTLGLAALADTGKPKAESRLLLAAEPAGVTMLVIAGGGLAAFRTFEPSFDGESGEKLFNAAAVARELRITLEQIPADLREGVRQLFITGDSALARQLAEGLAPWAASAELSLSRGDLPEKNHGTEIAQQLATRFLAAGAPELEFLPPRPSRWSLLMARYSSQRLSTIGAVVGAAAALAVAAFGWQEFRRWSLRSEWSGMEAQVKQLDAVQGRIRDYRPWYDTSFRTLSVLRRVSECFPENGSVTAKTFELHGNGAVSVSGTARDNAALLRVQDQLRKLSEVQGLKIEQIRGKTPAQFTFTFRWVGGSGS
jgi:hypothetical protein